MKFWEPYDLVDALRGEKWVLWGLYVRKGVLALRRFWVDTKIAFLEFVLVVLGAS